MDTRLTFKAKRYRCVFFLYFLSAEGHERLAFRSSARLCQHHHLNAGSKDSHRCCRQCKYNTMSNFECLLFVVAFTELFSGCCIAGEYIFYLC